MKEKSRFKVVDTKSGKSVSLPAFLASLVEVITENPLPEKSQDFTPEFMKSMILKSGNESEN